jgi:hypothetical protein
MQSGTSSVGIVKVVTTQDRGMNAEEWADLAVDRVISISDSAPMPIREQARAFREHVRQVMVFYFKKVARSERSTIASVLRKEGYSQIADKIEDLI